MGHLLSLLVLSFLADRAQLGRYLTGGKPEELVRYKLKDSVKTAGRINA
jgi:hypothetical protein